LSLIHPFSDKKSEKSLFFNKIEKRETPSCLTRPLFCIWYLCTMSRPLAHPRTAYFFHTFHQTALMRHLLLAFTLLHFAGFLAAQNPNCRPIIIARHGLAAPVAPLNTDADPEAEELGLVLKATDFLRSCYSPCGAASFQYRIRRAGFGTVVGVPQDSTVRFDCANVGSNEVELWAVDPQGNAAFAQTYVIVQDEQNLCDLPPQSFSTGCQPDGLAPSFVLHNGLAVNITPSASGGSARVLASDFVASRADNCSNFVRFRIRKLGAGTGVPATNSVTFTCQDVGFQEVEVWAGDLKGNWTRAITYALVQDTGINGSDCKVLASDCASDQIPATLEILNGFCVPIGVSGKVSMRVEEWLHKRTDNCGPSVALRIRKAGTAEGPPTSTQVEFACVDLGTREVEIWSRDLAGNWGYVLTYVIVQDNLGACGQMQGKPKDRSEARTTDPQLRLWPNPATDQIWLESRGEPFSRVEVTDLAGRMVQQVELGQPAQQHSLSVSDLPAGMYMVRVGGRVLQLVIGAR
jgi:hypothetical protein